MDVPRNSKDILAKHMTGAFPGDSLRVFGIPEVRVVRALPTELDIVEIRQEFTDIVLELDDGQILHLEHQSTKEATLYRFLGYDAQLARVFQRPISTVILYTEDIMDGPLELDTGSIQYAEQDYIAALILGLSGRNLTTRQEERLMQVLRMTHMVQEIEQKAREEGRMETAKAMLANGMDVALISEVTGLSLDEVQRLLAH